MTGSEKYRFDTEFDQSGNVIKERPPKPRTRFTLSDVEEIKAQSLEEGIRQGQASVEAQTAQAAAQQVAQIAESLAAIVPTLAAETEQARADAACLAFETAKGLAGALLEREPEQDIRNLIASCLADLRTEPFVRIEVAESVSEPISAYLTQAAAKAGLEGKVSVSGVATLHAADCRIEWATGGIEKSFEQHAETIRRKIEDYLNATSKSQLDLFAT